MSDVFSRDEVIECVYKALRTPPLKSVFTDTMSLAISMVNDMPSAQQWTPCSERLPEESGRYLVTRGLNACGSLWNRVYIANYSDLMGIKSERIWWQGNVGKPDFERLDDVLAWMPLPEPYKGEES